MKTNKLSPGKGRFPKSERKKATRRRQLAAATEYKRAIERREGKIQKTDGKGHQNRLDLYQALGIEGAHNGNLADLARVLLWMASTLRGFAKAAESLPSDKRYNINYISEELARMGQFTDGWASALELAGDNPKPTQSAA